MSDEEDRSIFRLEHVDDAKQMLKNGVLPEDVIRQLHDKGLTIVECIWVMSSASGLALETAKDLVVNHPVWNNQGEPGV